MDIHVSSEVKQEIRNAINNALSDFKSTVGAEVLLTKQTKLYKILDCSESRFTDIQLKWIRRYIVDWVKSINNFLFRKMKFESNRNIHSECNLCINQDKSFYLDFRIQFIVCLDFHARTLPESLSECIYDSDGNEYY